MSRSQSAMSMVWLVKSFRVCPMQFIKNAANDKEVC